MILELYTAANNFIHTLTKLQLRMKTQTVGLKVFNVQILRNGLILVLPWTKLHNLSMQSTRWVHN